MVGGGPTGGRALWVVRHAHAASGSATGDMGRPLDARGVAELSRVGAALGDLVASGALARPQLVLTSGAARARQTAVGLAAAVGAPSPSIETPFYRADAYDLLQWACGLDDAVEVAMLVGHNPAVAALTGLLVGSDAAGGFPTATVAVVELTDAPWGSLVPGEGRLVRTIHPG